MDVGESARNLFYDDKAAPVVLENEGGEHNLDGGVVEPSLGNFDAHPENVTVASQTRRKRRKRTSLRKAFVRPKRRGQRNKNLSTTPTAPPIALGDSDLAECLLSNDEDRVNFFEDLQSLHIHLQNKAVAAEEPDTCEQSSSVCALESDRQLSVNVDSILEPFPVSLREMSASEMSAIITSNVSNVTCLAQTQCDEIHHVKTELPSPTIASPSEALIEETLRVLRSRLPTPWVPVADKFGIHALQMSCTSTKTVQKQISISYEGDEDILVHCACNVLAKKILGAVSPGAVMLQECTMGIFCDRLCNIVKTLYQYQLCVGADDKDRKELWDYIRGAYIDRNLFNESSYDETCRSSACERLIVLGRGKRCRPCSELQIILRRRKLQSPWVHVHTNNRFLSLKQAQEKLKTQHEELRKKDKQIEYLKKKIEPILEDEGVDIDLGSNEDLSSTLGGSPPVTLEKLSSVNEVL